jgi:TRAP-type C4-dicarboxylate transport system permease small subunit
MAAQSAVQLSAGRRAAVFAAAARAVRVITGLQLCAAGLLFIGATIVYAAEIVMRGFLNTGYPDYYEVVGFAFIYIFMFGASALYARNQDITIDMLYVLVPLRMQKVWLLIIHLAIAVTMAITLFYTWRLIGLQSTTPTPLLRIPEAVKWWPLAIAAASMVMSSLVEAWSCAIWMNSGTRPKIWPDELLGQETPGGG